ncbi:MAG: ATP-dependent DNA helicase [Candidatus Parvarchaeum sp.]
MAINKNDIFNKPYKLSQEQIEAVGSNYRYIKVVAGAGTGKTETLTRRIVYLLLHKEVPPKNIVAFTFTEMAAQDMKSRIYDRLIALGGKDAAFNLGDMYVGTIHGFCYRVLQDNLGYGNHEMIDENTEMALLINNLGWELGLNKDPGRNYTYNCSKFLRSVNLVYDELIDKATLKINAKSFYKRLQRYEEFHDKHKLLTFSRSIALLVEKLNTVASTLKNIKYLVVDEYQDINNAQEKLIEAIGKTAEIFIVGDPRQTIYQWRGSNENYFSEFGKKFKSTQEINIVENRRSDSTIVDVSNTLINNQNFRYVPLKSVNKESGSVFCLGFSTPESEASWIANQIKRLVDSGKIAYQDIAILFRSVSTSSKSLINAFKQMNIPFIVGGKIGLFKRSEIRAVAMLLVWLYDNGFWSESSLNEAKKLTGDQLLEKGIQIWHESTGKTTKIDELRKWKENILGGGSSDLIKEYNKLLKILGYYDFNPQDEIDAVIMANLGKLSSIIKDFEVSIGLGGKKKLNIHTIKGLFWYIHNYALTAYEEPQSDDQYGIPAVKILTIHQAKGLEWPVVFIPSMVNRRFPNSNVGKRGDWYIPQKLFDYKRYEGNIDDERRLFYVALTRAKNHLILSYFQQTQKNRTTKSTFLDEISSKVKFIRTEDDLNLGNIRKKDYPNEIQTFPITEIVTYKKCPYFYQFRFIFGYNSSLDEFLGYGKSLHFCLRNIADEFKVDKSSFESINSIINKNFHLPFAHPKQNLTARAAATKELSLFVKTHLEDIKKINDVEVRLEFPLNRAIVVGRADVIIKINENGLEVRDYKTSDEVITKEESDLQVRLYMFGLNSLGKNVVSASIANIKENQIRKVDTNKSEIEDSVNETRKIIDSIKAAEYPPITGKHCLKCDFLTICKFGKNYIDSNKLV